jgi:hypothetical protein
MKSPEEEADSELGKRLREKFEGYKVPGEDRARAPIFAALGQSSFGLYRTAVISGLLLIAVFFLFDLTKLPTGFDKKGSSVLNKNKTNNPAKKQAKPDLETQSNPGHNDDLQLKYAQPALKNNLTSFKNKRTTQKPGIKIAGKTENADITPPSLEHSAAIVGLTKAPLAQTEKTGPGHTYMNTAHKRPVNTSRNSSELDSLSPIDAINISVSFGLLTIPPTLNATKEPVKKPAMKSGLKGVFSASIMQTFQLVSLSPSAEDRVQNLQFVPLLSSKSLSYKLTAGIEKRNTQALLSYTYLRNWNEYEIGTNQVIATRVGHQQYDMTIIGEKHFEDERSHLLGIGIRQRFQVPKHVLKNYSVDLGIDYTRLMRKEQDLVWGNIGFYKNIYGASGIRLDVGPYLQYSFTQRQVAQQTWKSRPYQVGISLGVKLK